MKSPLSLHYFMSCPEIIAHRGASHDAPENTRAAIRLAWEQSADAVEIDVHLCKDNQIVVMHDQNTRRTTGFDAEIADLTGNELRRLDAGSWKGAAFKDEPVPTLDEVLPLLPAQKRLFIEIKGDQKLLLPLQDSLQNVRPAQIVLIGFDYALMQAAKATFSQFETLWLRGAAPLWEHEKPDFSTLLEQTFQLCRQANLDGLDVSREWLENEMIFERARESRLKLCAYTINDGVFARYLSHCGVNGITSDRPAFLRAQLQASSAAT